MFRFAVLSLALLSAPALAGPFQADPQARPAHRQFVVRDNIWRCGESGCVSTNRSSTRPAIVCSALARRVGALRGFSSEGRAFGAEELENCNRSAR